METKPSKIVEKLEAKDKIWWRTTLSVVRDIVLTLLGIDLLF